ncbi:MAG: hypothetical protein QOG64_2978 [Acidimicrobiaceae bacterium]|nr:hypothetical protein [Acidimicrobiaceae bacterium]
MVRGDWRDWHWDETLFAGAAQHYQRGRLPYAPGLAAAMAASLGLDGTGRLLDVGCGPGTIALRLAHLFEAVVGLDPDPGMLAEAERWATTGQMRNARWINLRAEALPAGLGQFRVITFAASFHWMDRPAVARTVLAMLAPGGAVVHVDTRLQHGFSPDRPLPHPAVPYEAISELRRRWLGHDRRAGRSIRNTSPDDEDDVFRAAGFEGPQRVPVPDGRVLERSVGDVVAETFSMSSTAPHLFGDGIDQFEAELVALLERASSDGRFSAFLPANGLKIWRPE